MPFSEGELAKSVDSHEHVQLSVVGSHLGDVEVDVTDRVFLESLLRLVPLDARQPADVVALEQSVQARTGQVRNAGLKCEEAVVERQQRVLAEGDDQRFLL